MTERRIENHHIISETPIITPNQLKERYPLNEKIINTVFKGQHAVKEILDRKDKRILMVVGPCSIHDVSAAKEYATRLKKLADELSDTLLLVMRVYFEKPRTTVGWSGLINDPYLDNSGKIEEGLKQARELLTFIANMGLPAAGEALDIVTPQYIQDLFSWTAIGARTTESHSHRKMASGLTSAVGFKNGTDGNINVAINALESVAAPHSFVSINPDGHVAVVQTKGNCYGHIILRGGKVPNYAASFISEYETLLSRCGLPVNIMVDCSHANSRKKADNQCQVLDDLAGQIEAGNQSIAGVMIESNLRGGKQVIPADLSLLQYGVSVTDECIDWETTESVLRNFAARVKPFLLNRK